MDKNFSCLICLEDTIFSLTDYERPLKSRTFGLGQTNWAYKFWGIWGIFGQTIFSTHFGTMSSLSMLSIIQPLFFFKKLKLYIHISNSYLELGLGFEFGAHKIRDLAFVCP